MGNSGRLILGIFLGLALATACPNLAKSARNLVDSAVAFVTGAVKEVK